MRTWTRTITEREGENMGPIDWTHANAKDKPALWREVEKRPGDFRYSPSDFTAFPIIEMCMYDGWPFWKPLPAFAYHGPLGREWAFFTDYGVSADSIFEWKPKPVKPPKPDEPTSEPAGEIPF